VNASLPDNHPSIDYYDSDYPSRDGSEYPENFDAITEIQGLAHDVERFLEIAEKVGGPVLELCCGTGRVALALARKGHEVVGVDVSEAMLERFRNRLEREEPDVIARITLVRQDVTRLDLPAKDYPLAIAPFNSLLCVTDFEGQLECLRRAAQHLREGGALVVDAVNPHSLPVQGDPVPKPFFTRRNVRTGRWYTRFAAIGPMEPDQRQKLFGWYDELEENGRVRRTPYSLHWRPIHRYELELMLRIAGFTVEAVQGGHRGEPFTLACSKLFVIAKKRSDGASRLVATREEEG